MNDDVLLSKILPNAQFTRCDDVDNLQSSTRQEKKARKEVHVIKIICKCTTLSVTIAPVTSEKLIDFRFVIREPLALL